MGKVFERVRMWSLFDEAKVERGELAPLEVDVIIDTGATNAVLGPELSDRLGLKRTRPVTVEYADGRKSTKDVAIGLRVEAFGRSTELRAILEPGRRIPLLGQIFLEDTCLLVDCKNRRLIPDPAHGGEEVHEIWGTRTVARTTRVLPRNRSLES